MRASPNEPVVTLPPANRRPQSAYTERLTRSHGRCQLAVSIRRIQPTYLPGGTTHDDS